MKTVLIFLAFLIIAHEVASEGEDNRLLRGIIPCGVHGHLYPDGCWRCDANSKIRCHNGKWSEKDKCPEGRQCCYQSYCNSHCLEKC